jgi:hypothetical protein
LALDEPTYAEELQAVEVEDQIRGLVPISAAGLLCQLRLLAQWGRDFEWDDILHEPLIANMRSGLLAIAAGGAE